MHTMTSCLSKDIYSAVEYWPLGRNLGGKVVESCVRGYWIVNGLVVSGNP